MKTRIITINAKEMKFNINTTHDIKSVDGYILTISDFPDFLFGIHLCDRKWQMSELSTGLIVVRNCRFGDLLLLQGLPLKLHKKDFADTVKNTLQQGKEPVNDTEKYLCMFEAKR